jgi:hypothetical protein
MPLYRYTDYNKNISLAPTRWAILDWIESDKFKDSLWSVRPCPSQSLLSPSTNPSTARRTSSPPTSSSTAPPSLPPSLPGPLPTTASQNGTPALTPPPERTASSLTTSVAHISTTLRSLVSVSTQRPAAEEERRRRGRERARGRRQRLRLLRRLLRGTW